MVAQQHNMTEKIVGRNTLYITFHVFILLFAENTAAT
jgi:hypothetical protein